ncbi:DUF1642 domain-containing protein [Enterococcus faecalis]|uniref:DUF1642 domain-containing protein n=1 Tax=Enterococcus faecalis TaxID=1351 RepID=UPI000FFE7D0E|nr:DUF1642 domain-containing protein [Enterococcus faecalis]RXF36682.1 DUF1642 domain-containing protein [Enterococcus faecalis]
MNKQELIDILEKLECSTESLSYDNGYEQGIYDSLSHVILLDEPKKVVIPKFVAEWIGYATLKGDSLIASFKPWDLYGAEYGKVNSWIKDNEETYARAWLDGYEVEEDPLYYVKLPEIGGICVSVKSISIQLIKKMQNDIQKTKSKQLMSVTGRLL